MAFPFGAVIPAVGNFLGGLFGSDSNKKAAKANAKLQREFAQNSIQWRVEDARKAGVSPIYALGAPTMSASPSFVGDTSMPQALSNMGQDLGRAFDVTRNGQEKMDAKMQALTLERGALENDLLRAQIFRLAQQSSPNFPTGDQLMLPGQGDTAMIDITPPSRTPNLVGDRGTGMATQPAMDAQTVENRYGDLAQEFFGAANIINDMFPALVPFLQRPVSSFVRYRPQRMGGQRGPRRY